MNRFNIGDKVQKNTPSDMDYGKFGEVIEVDENGRTRILWTHHISGKECYTNRTWLKPESLTGAGNITPEMVKQVKKAQDERWTKKYGNGY